MNVQCMTGPVSMCCATVAVTVLGNGGGIPCIMAIAVNMLLGICKYNVCFILRWKNSYQL